MDETLRFYTFAALAGLGALATAFVWKRLRRKTPEQLEQERRRRISEIGRITGGTVIDVSEMTTDKGSAEIQLLSYQCNVAGLRYEAAHDVTSLRHRVNLHTFPA